MGFKVYFILFNFIILTKARENCNKYYPMCGDVCLDFLIVRPDVEETQTFDCICGDEKFSTILDDTKYCCVPTSNSSSPEFCEKDLDNQIGLCSSADASIIDRTRSCHRKCYQDLRYNKVEIETVWVENEIDLPSDSSTEDIIESVFSQEPIKYEIIRYSETDRFLCSSGDQCVELKNICRGAALCQDKSDLQLCHDTLPHVKYCGYDRRRRHIETELVNHSYCLYDSNKDNQREYETIGRSDVSSIVAEFKHRNPRIAKLIKEDHDDTDNEYDIINDEDNEYGFHSNNNCNRYHRVTGELLEFGLRCSGYDFHCYYPLSHWGERSCHDKSDQVYNIGLECQSQSLLENFKTQSCYDGKDLNNICLCKYKCAGPNVTTLPHPSQDQIDLYDKYKDYCRSRYSCDCSHFCNLSPEDTEQFQRNLTEKYFFTTFLTNCQASCSYPGTGCVACTNPRYFKCTKNNIPICLHPDLVCDGVPNCDSSIDESDCLDQYFTRNIVSPHATFQCPKYQYPGFPIYCKILFF